MSHSPSQARRVALGVVTLALLPLVAAFAGDAPAAKPAAPPPGVAEIWTMWPMAGHEAQFLAAAKAHLAWRKEAGDKVKYMAFQPIAGRDLGYYSWRSDEHAWADFDAHRAWAEKAGAAQRFGADVMPHVERIQHVFEEVDFAHSYWTDSPDYRMFSVNRYTPRGGTYGEITAALDKIHKAAVDGKWGRSWGISWLIGGDNAMMVVFPYRNYAEMAEPDPPFMKMLATSLGSEEAAGATMKAIGGAFDAVETTLYVARPDLSTP